MENIVTIRKLARRFLFPFSYFYGRVGEVFLLSCFLEKWALRSECRRYLWQSLSLVMSVQMLRYFLQTKTCIRMTVLESSGSFHPPLFLIYRSKMNMAVTTPVIMTTCVSCRSPFATTWVMMWFCSPRMGHIRIFHIAGHCRDSTPRWTLVQVGVLSNRKPGQGHVATFYWVIALGSCCFKWHGHVEWDASHFP